MGNLFSQQCDLCPKVQTDADHTKIKGTSITMNGVTKFACGECQGILNAAFAVGADGLRDPILALSKVTKECEDLKRLLAQASVKREPGDLGMIGLELDHKSMQNYNALSQQERFAALGQGGGFRPPQLGQVPVAGAGKLGFKPEEAKDKPKDPSEDKSDKKPKKKGFFRK